MKEEIEKLIVEVEKRKLDASQYTGPHIADDKLRILCAGEIIAYNFILEECKKLISK